jgi:hypothetical protein
MLEAVIVGAIVTVCAGHVAWTLLPPPLARLLLRWPLPLALATALRRRAQGCGCSGCDHAAAPPDKMPQAQALRWLPRKPR